MPSITYTPQAPLRWTIDGYGPMDLAAAQQHLIQRGYTFMDAATLLDSAWTRAQAGR